MDITISMKTGTTIQFPHIFIGQQQGFHFFLKQSVFFESLKKTA
ncbi:hypothetical protein EVA_03131 [gut metagenome]|uniref:Uncharacterized protein n=1 Tax=gut metagenome TaxID=749906 RepID=J9GMI6_9ZZZZ